MEVGKEGAGYEYVAGERDSSLGGVFSLSGWPCQARGGIYIGMSHMCTIAGGTGMVRLKMDDRAGCGLVLGGGGGDW